jgi:hypothetical protein
MAQESSKLLITMRSNFLIAEMVSKLLFENHDVASKFAATCKEAWHLLMKNGVSTLSIEILIAGTNKAFPDFLGN